MKNPIIKYKLIDDEWKTIELSPSEFYDADESEFLIFDSVERHFLEPRNYVSAEIDKFSFLIIILENEKGEKVITRLTYWDKGKSHLEEYSEIENNKVRFRNFILSVCLDEAAEDVLVVRFDSTEENLIPITQVMLRGDAVFKSFDVPKFL
jgi:hypothetical protein